MTSKIFRSTMFVIALILVCSLSIFVGVLYRYFTDIQISQLKDELSLAATATEQYGNTFLENVEADRFRITWIAADGTVLFDTQSVAESMESHADREEFQQALQSGFGSSVRHSATLTAKTYYEAKLLQDGTVLRISSTQASVAALILGMLQPIIVVIIIAIILSLLLAGKMAKNIVEPLNRLNLEHPLQNEVYEEVSPLLQRINLQHLQISAQLQALNQKSEELEQIITNMHEGLVLLGRECNIVRINPTAKSLFGVDDSCIGRTIFTVPNSEDLRDAVNAALGHGHGTARIARNGRDFRLDLSRIESDGKILGAVLLAFDITQALHAEQTRREFSANVSHELKTPLQSIMGSAELIESKLVKQEDIPHFVGNIRKESARLLNLIEDIIRLSQLDEGQAPPKEDVDLLAVCQEVVRILEKTVQNGVSLQVSGVCVQIYGIRQLLFDLVYNLCENAIKYNIPNGSVQVLVQEKDGRCILSVSDTGIGIPAEHVDRIFERFYRVDKSHSRQSGGTGLGLSIVKHAAQYHNAELQVQSSPGKGTTITVTF